MNSPKLKIGGLRHLHHLGGEEYQITRATGTPRLGTGIRAVLEERIWDSNANVAADIKGEADILTLVESVEQKEKGTKHRTLGEGEQALKETQNKQSVRWRGGNYGKGPCYERQGGLCLKSSS